MSQIKNLFFSTLVSLLLFPSAAWAANFTVSTVPELRDAIQDANGNGEADVIELNPGNYVLDGASGEDSGASGDLDITSDITLNGAGAGQSTLSGAGEDRLIHILGPGNVFINNLTLQGGRLTEGSGSALFIEAAATLTINNSQIVDNVTNTISGPKGGAIDNIEGNLFINNSLIYDNQAIEGSGGGVLHRAGRLELINATISQNASQDDGGGVTILDGEALILNSTITGNSTDSSSGEGIKTRDLSLTLGNSVVAYNFSEPNVGPDITGDWFSLGGNVVGVSGLNSPITFLVVDPKPSDVLGTLNDPVDAMLGPLQDNGGPTRTHAPLPGSPAINNGEDAQCTDQDQRGVGRPLQGQCDAGAFEVGCGDGNLESPQEACDDGNNIDGDGCSSICKLESTGGGGGGSNNASAGGCGQINPGPVGGRTYFLAWIGTLMTIMVFRRFGQRS